jgi:hypothetical protein
MLVEETKGGENIVNCMQEGQYISILADKGSCGNRTVGGELATYTS